MSKGGALLISCSVILLCLAVVLGLTYALFSDTETVNHHLKAGNLDITLTRTNLTTVTLDNKTGYLVKKESPDDVDFSNTNANIFDVSEDALIVPGCEYVAEMQISNNSDAAFSYWAEIVFDDKDDLALADQLEVVIIPYGIETESKFLSEGFNVGSETDPVGTLAKGASQLFTVSVKFIDDDEVNNAAKKQAVDFDLVIHAIQATNVAEE